MMSILRSILMSSCIVSCCITVKFGSTQHIDLGELYRNKKLTVYNRVATLEQQGTRTAIVLNEDVNEGLVVIPDLEFSTGTIEFDIKGQNVFQHSFVGVAFHFLDSNSFDAVYFRPFQFLSTDSVLHRRSVQYISWPEYTWQKLRKDGPGQFENTIKPVPDPDNWFHAKIIVKEKKAEVFVNDSKTPSLVVPLLNKRKKGKIALYTADRSGGSFANLAVKADL